MTGEGGNASPGAEALERIEGALAEVPAALDPLAAAEELRRRLPADLARRAALLRELRARAAAKLAGAHELQLTRRGLEQATATAVADARARRIAARAPGLPVLDATAGIGGDSLALAARGLRVLALERDAETALCLAANLRRRAPASLAVRADATTPPVAAIEDWLLVLDPDRRAGVAGDERRRLGDPASWSPPWSRCVALAARARGAVLKLPPALEPSALVLGELACRPHAWQWVSLAGELRELALYTGALAPPPDAGPEPDAGEREALVIDRAGRESTLRGRPAAPPALDPARAASVAWIVEPDPAVLRAGLAGVLAREHGLEALAPGLGYLAAAAPEASPLFTAWPVRGNVPLDRKRVQALLAEHGVGPITVKKRGLAEPAESLARRLGGRRGRRGTLVVVGLPDGHRAYLVGAPLRPPRNATRENERVGDEGFEPPASSL